MKAKFFLLGLCALALAACSIDEVSQINDTNAVTFKATTITRADVTTTNNLASFSVWAWNGENEFMDDVIATRSGSSSTFTTSPLYFWPTGTVDFYALTPATEVTAIEDGVEYAYLGGTLNEGSDTDPTWTYTGNVAKAQIENGNIVIDAVIPSKPEEQIDLCYAVALNKESGSVPMNFRHALSQIAFKAKNTNEAMEVKIADVSVCSVYKEGVFTIGKYDTSEHLATSDLGTDGISGTQGVWVLTTTDPDTQLEIKGRYLVDMTSNIVDVPTGGDVVELVDPYGTLMLLPQEVEAWDPETDYNDQELGSYIRILCNVMESGSQIWPNNNAEAESSELGDAFWTDPEGVEYAEIAIPVEALWEQGYRYTYTIVFGEGLGYYPPDDPNTDLEGTPVLVPITFTVTVDEFQDATGVDGQYDLPTDTDLSYIPVKTQAELLGAIHMGYQEIEVTESLTLEDAYLEFTQDCILDLDDGVVITPQDVTAVDDPANIGDGQTATSAILISGGTLTINAGEGAGIITNGSSSLDTSCFWLDGGNLVINGGTYKGGTWNDPTGQTYKGASATVYVQEGFAYIYGGEFYGGWSGSMIQTSLLNCWDNNYPDYANIYCYGGTYQNFDPAACNSEDGSHTGQTNFCAEGYGTVKSDDVDDDGFHTYTVILTTVATPADLAAALAAGASEITVSESFSIEQGTGSGYFWSYNDCTITLEDGVTISLDEMDSIANYAFFIAKAGTLTIEGNGTLKSNGSTQDMGCMCFWLDGGDVVINGGNFYSAAWAEDSSSDTAACVYVNLGTATINGGSFYGSHNVTAYSGSSYLLNCTDKNYTSGTAKIYVYGGEYCDFDPADNYAEGANTNFCASGYKSVVSDEPDSDGWYWYTVVEDK